MTVKWETEGGKTHAKLVFCCVVCFLFFFFAFDPVNMQFVYLSNIHTWMVHCLLWVSAGKLWLHAQRVWMNWDRLVQETATAKTGGKNGDYIKGTWGGKHLIPLGGAIAGLKQQMKCMQIHWEGKIKTMIIRISPFQTLRSAINRHVKHMLHTHGQVQHKSRKTLQTRHLN